MRVVVYPHMLSIGGSQLNAVELAAAVRDRGHSVTVFGDDGPLVGYVRELGLPFVPIPRYRFRPSVAISEALRDLCRRERIDVVHASEWPPCIEAFSGPHLRDGVAMTCTLMSMSVAPFLPPSVPLTVGTHEIAEGTRRDRSGPVRVLEPPVDTVANHPGIDATEFRTRLGLDGHPPSSSSPGWRWSSSSRGLSGRSARPRHSPRRQTSGS